MGFVLHLEESVYKIQVVHLLICFCAAPGRVCLQELLCCSWTCLCKIAFVLLLDVSVYNSSGAAFFTHAKHVVKKFLLMLSIS
jgi:hypothetical protein